MKKQLQDLMTEISGDAAINFFPQDVEGDCGEPDKSLTVVMGDNNLQTSFQYTVRQKGTKVMTIKVYDKILDLIGREGSKAIGSRLCDILGSKRKAGSSIEERVRKA